MGGLRHTKARAPWVSDPLGGVTFAPVDAQYVTMALNGTLTQERVLTAGEGITIVDGGANSSVTIHALDRGIPTFHDDFQTSKPFWDATQAITSGDWSINTGTNKLDGIAENNTEDWIRRGVEGDIDYRIKVERGTAVSIGMELQGGDGSPVARWSRRNGDCQLLVTGEATISPVVGADTMWLRLTWTTVDETLRAYYKVNDTDPWTLQQTYTGKAFEFDKILTLDSANGGYIQEIELYDNMDSHQVKALAPNKILLTDGANIAVDASKGNFFEVTLGGNRQLDNPTNANLEGQMILFRIWQDGTGSRTLSFDTKYRFSTDLPSPTLTTAAGDYDYLGFIYNEADDVWDFVSKVFGFPS